MALTKDEWYLKLKSWVPRWFFEKEQYNVAVFKGMAAVLASLDGVAQAHFIETFLSRADGFYIDAQGDERSIPRLPNEPDSLYYKRVQLLTNHSDVPSIKALVDSFLIQGESIIYEHFEDGPFLNRDTYLNNRFIFNDFRYYDYFTILVPKQNELSDSFCSVDTYSSRSNFLGNAGTISAATLLASIVAAVQANKADGVLFRLIEE